MSQRTCSTTKKGKIVIYSSKKLELTPSVHPFTHTISKHRNGDNKFTEALYRIPGGNCKVRGHQSHTRPIDQWCCPNLPNQSTHFCRRI